jgi:signal transduction histidine kinase/CheY-like chemotaxis protein
LSNLPPVFEQQYAAALESQITDAGEAALHQAYELGRQALNAGLSVLDLILLHHDTLGRILINDPVEDAGLCLRRAAGFLAECVSPFEMTLLGYRESNLRLTALNEKLYQANLATELANEQLATEMTVRQRAEEALRQSQKLQAIGQLAGGVAHHFNNLLTAVLCSLDFARASSSENQAVADRLDLATRAAERGATVTRQLLTFSRQQILRPEVLDPSTRLPDLALLLSSALRGNIKIEIDIPAGLWAIKIDPAELELALLNLSINAQDAMPNGGVLRISAENRHIGDAQLGLDGEYLAISVGDTGSGISPEILPRIFDPFFTTKDVNRGTGLGLSQVHGFAHQSNGAVDVESVVEHGTVFRLYLPAADAPAAARGEQPHRHPSPGTVLIVEDDTDVAEIAAALLQECGFKVHVADHAQLALELLGRGEDIDLVFSDVLMPGGMDGIELAQEVKRKFPRLPVLLATGYSDALSDATRNGLQIISKPYRPKELCDQVCKLIDPVGSVSPNPS